MNAERYLQSIRDLKRKTEIYEKMKREIQETVKHIKTSAPDMNKVQTSAYYDGLEKKIIKNMEQLEELDSWIAATKAKQLSRKQEAYNTITQLKDGQCKRFLLDYYIDGKTEKKIAREYCFYNEKSVYNLKKRAIKHFEKVYKKY